MMRKNSSCGGRRGAGVEGALGGKAAASGAWQRAAPARAPPPTVQHPHPAALVPALPAHLVDLAVAVAVRLCGNKAGVGRSSSVSTGRAGQRHGGRVLQCLTCCCTAALATLPSLGLLPQLWWRPDSPLASTSARSNSGPLKAPPPPTVDHLLQLLVRDVLPQLLGHALQVLERDLARLVVVKQAARGGKGWAQRQARSQ